MSIAEKLTTIAQNQQKVFEAGGLAYSPKGNVSGEVVSITDISPIEHNLGVKLSSKNLISYPYADTTKTMNGIIFTDNGDGSITCNGTATANATFIIFSGGNIILPNVIYNLSGCVGGAYGIYDLRISDGKTKAYASYNQNGVSFSYADTSTITISILVSKGQTLNNVVFKPMIEKGTKATAYTPYVDDVSTTTLNTLGKNIYNPIGRATSKIERALTIQYLKDEDCYLLNGTVVGLGNYYQIDENIFVDDYISLACEVVSGSVDNPNNGHVRFYVGSKDDENGSNTNWKSITITSNNCVTSETSKRYIAKSWFYLSDGITFNNYKVRVSIEKGKNTNTTYEPYIQPTTYKPMADGTVEGVKSIYPTTTLMTDTSGVLIEVEYYQDGKKVKENLTNVILSLGGILND